jgi:hemerythrin-like domain-containing protein
MINNPLKLITTLKAQHRGLQNDLNIVADELKLETTSINSVIIPKLAKFKNNLLEHLKLENEEFYPDYLSKKEKKGEDITSSEEFIKLMDEIGKTVLAFLDKYSIAEAVESSQSVFKDELSGIIDTLNTRIETEEDGVYDLYLLY